MPKVRVLTPTWIGGVQYFADDTPDLPEAEVAAAKEQGAVDDDPAAVAYAESLPHGEAA